MIIDNLPDHWDLEADVVAVGSGGGGLAAAITAHDHGASALVLERTDQVGGVTAYSLGEVWVPGNHLETAAGIEDSWESGFRYVQRLAMGYANDIAALNQAVHAPEVIRYFEAAIGLRMMIINDCPDYYYKLTNDAVAQGRLLECEPFDATRLGEEWQEKTRVSPHVLYGLTHEDIFSMGGSANIKTWDFTLMGERLARDERCLGSGLVGYFVKGALDRAIPMHTGLNAEELIGDGARVVGLRATKDGRDIFVKANRGVVLAVSSFERNPDFNLTIGKQLDSESIIMPEIDGAHFRMAGCVGARIASVPDVTMLGFTVPGEELQEGVPLWRNPMAFMGLPHTIMVNHSGKRFANESFYRSLFFEIDRIDGQTQTNPNFPCWAILDSQAREKYPWGPIMPGADMPEEVATRADTLEELGRKLGIDAAELVATVERFNSYCATGQDAEFGRGSVPWGAYMSGDRFQKVNPNFGTIEKGPFYAVHFKRLANSGISSAGIMADQHMRALNWRNEPIDGLYVAGNSVARIDTGAAMQSGMSNARGMTHGYLAGRHAAGKPSELLKGAIEKMGL